MSELWLAKIQKKEGNKVEIKISPTHPDAGNFPLNKEFLMLFLTQEAYQFDDNFNRIPASPLGELIPFDSSYFPDSVAPYIDQVVEEVSLIEKQNVPWDMDKLIAEFEGELRAQGIEEGSDAWQEAIEEFHSDIWDDSEKVPYVVYEVVVTDPKWIEHLSEGMSFDSTAYSYNGPWIGIDV